MKQSIKRSEVWLCDFDPTKKDEIGKIRPALVIQNNDIDIGTVIVIPFSTNIVSDSEPLRINYNLPFLDKNSDLAITQIRTLSTTRFIKKIGHLENRDMLKIAQCLKLILNI